MESIDDKSLTYLGGYPFRFVTWALIPHVSRERRDKEGSTILCNKVLVDRGVFQCDFDFIGQYTYIG